jgi:hypothetical protein
MSIVQFVGVPAPALVLPEALPGGEGSSVTLGTGIGSGGRMPPEPLLDPELVLPGAVLGLLPPVAGVLVEAGFGVVPRPALGGVADVGAVGGPGRDAVVQPVVQGTGPSWSVAALVRHLQSTTCCRLLARP